MFHIRDRLRSLVRAGLSCTGKGDEKVACVFGVSEAACHHAVLHIREGAPGVPIWLFTTVGPLPETQALCERIYRNQNTLALLASAQTEVWKRWVAISVGMWTGDHGPWILKLAPFLIPPFRVLILNRDGGFFKGTPGNVLVHAGRATWDGVQSGWGYAREAVHSLHVGARETKNGALEAIHRVRAQCGEVVRRTRIRSRDLLHGLRKLSAATGLLVLSRLLRWTFNPHLKLFSLSRGKQPLLLETAVAEGEEVARFTQGGLEWDGEALEEFALKSDARWILWRQESGSDFLSDGGMLFEDARTFAISRQMNFRGWQANAATTAPFRALQAGEASRVLAPLSQTILLDRKKLLALGVPRSSMPATAWLILFWKAAAAGWRSYSLGQNGPVREQADFPIQETAFVLRALTDRTIGCLSPRQEELSKGNIGFAPGFHRMADRNSERLKVLIVSPFLPYPLSHGGAVRMFNLCRELSSRVDFTLIAMREANDVVDYATLHEVFREVHVVDKDERTKPDKSLPAQVSSSESKSLRALIDQLAQKILPDLIQFEYTHFAGFRENAPGVPAILVEHDLTFSLYRQLAEANPSPAAWKEHARWLAFERKWLAAYEGVWTVSEEDRARAMSEGRRGADRTFAIANGVDIDRYQPRETSTDDPEVFYVGSFRHLPNVIGFEKLTEEIMPRVWANAPNARLRVVAGPDYERYWKQFGRKSDLGGIDPRIEVHGFVEDLRPLYARASVVAVPLEVSAGTNIKVLEAMACGKAIVTTPVGCAGLELKDEHHVAIREDWGAFADAIGRILSNNDLRLGLGMRARKTAEQHFSWAAIADQAYESYLTIAGKPASKGVPSRSLTVA